MNPPPLHPPRPLRWAARLARALLWAVVGMWLLVGMAWAAIHFLIVPRVADWRTELEGLATRAVGVPVRIGQVAVHTRGLVPSFELNAVQLLGPQGKAALSLERVRVAVSARSLLRMGFEQLHIERPTLEVRRTRDGRWWVAGLEVGGGPTTPAPPPLADWFFSQTEWVIRQGTVHWTDELSPHPPGAFTGVDMVVRNPGRRHLMRVDATPPPHWGGRVTVQADLASPFLTLHPGRWQQWSGTAHAELPALDLARVAVPSALAQRLGLAVHQGSGAARLWLDIDQGSLTGGTADLALVGVHARFSQARDDWRLARLQGRFNIAWAPDHTRFSTEGLSMDTQPGARWVPGDVSLVWHPTAHGGRGTLQTSRLDLAALHQLAHGLPLPDAVQTQLSALQPRGDLSALRLTWETGTATGSRYSAQGRVQHLALAPGPEPDPQPLAPGEPPRPVPGRPGLAGAQVTFDVNQDGGHASVTLERGWLSFPGVFDEPQLPLDSLAGEVRWQLRGPEWRVQLSRLRFANADLQGLASAQWRTSDPDTSPSGSRFPGVLTLEGGLSRAKADRVHRYMPRVVGTHARDYVRAAISGGQARQVRFRVAGDLWDMPFADATQGEFKVVAPLQGVDYAYIPPSHTPPGELPWPALKQASGELVFERTRLSVRIDRADVAQAPGLRVVKGTARIADLMRPVVEVDGQLEGPLAQALAVVRRSPLSGMTAQALSAAQGTGTAGIRFGLTVPLDNTLQTQVKGRVTLAGNDLTLTPGSPLLGRTRGAVDFSESGFWVSQATAQVGGGELQFSGGLRAGDPVVRFTGRGLATVAGLAQAPQLGLPRGLLAHAEGGATYTVQLALTQGQSDWAVQSDLKGLALNLPPPLTKPADRAWALFFDSRLASPADNGAAPQETVTLRLQPDPDTQGHLHWQRAVGPNGPGPLRGWARWGPGPAPARPLPAQGWALQLQLPELDADAWLNPGTATPTDIPPKEANAGPHPGDSALPLPAQVQLDTPRLRVWGRDFHGVQLQARHETTPSGPGRWRARVAADELAGTLEYTPAHANAPGQGDADTRDGQLQARLQRLRLNSRNDGNAPTTTTPLTDAVLPAVDMAVDAFVLDGRDLGQLTLNATNRTTAPQMPREWLLHRLALRVPEAELTASGTWGPAAAPASGVAPRRTQLQVALAVKDSGALLQRFGMPGVFRGGQGQVTGSLAWDGAPTRLHTPSLSGQLKLDMASGQFLKADPGLAKLLGVLSLQSLPRRLALDFSDVFTQGFAFDFVRGDAHIDRGVLATNNLQMKGPNAAVLMEGEADIESETQRIRAVVVPELNAGTASLIATVINPAAGLGSFLAQAVLRQPLIAASSQSFLIHGPWANPQVDKITTLPEGPHPTPR